MSEIYQGAAKRLEDTDLPRIGASIGVGEDELRAFMEVEAAGSGFDRHGRVKMLFEPHVFYRTLTGSKRAEAVKQGLAYPRWGTKPYPADSYPRLEKALEIDAAAAFRSASWGLGQIMGENFDAAGYDSVEAMISDFAEDEDNHLEAMVRFLVAEHLDDDLRAHRWEALARGYNGPGYAKNRYHTKLAAAYAKWQKVKDTPYRNAPEPGTAPMAPKPVARKPDPPVAAAPVDTVDAVVIEPTAAPPPIVRERKPVLKHRSVRGILTSLGGSTGVLAMFTGFDWKAMAVMGGLAVLVLIWFSVSYKDEIKQGMFSA